MMLFTKYGNVEIGSVEGLTEDQIEELCAHHIAQLKAQCDEDDDYVTVELVCGSHSIDPKDAHPANEIIDKLDDEIPF